MQPQPASRRPEAARIRLHEGGRVRVELAGGRSPARLIARLRSGDAQVAVPVVPGEEGPVADLHLPAGDGGVQLWDLQVERSDGRAARLFDSRESAKTEWVAAGPGRVLSAVRTAKGNATLRLAPAPPAAEVREVRPSENGFLLSGRVRELPDLTDGATVVAVPREEGDEVVAPSTFDGDRFSAQVPYALLSGHGRWDLALRLSGEGGRTLRLRAGPAGDVMGRPALAMHELQRDGRDVRMELYPTVNGNLSLRAAPVPSPPPPYEHRPAPAVVRLLVEGWFRVVERRTARRRRTSAPLGQRRPRVYFLSLGVYGMGGIVSTTFRTAHHLRSAGHRVEVISVLQAKETTFFPVDDGIRLRPLFDERARTGPVEDEPGKRSRRARLRTALLRRLDRWESLLTHPAEDQAARTSLATDLLTVRTLQRLRPGVLVTTRPAQTVAAARFAAPHVRTLGQEHISFPTYPEELVRWMLPSYARLDALALLTEGDRRDFAARLGDAPVRLLRVPNGLPRLPSERADPASKVVVAAGRLSEQKGFDMLVPAFAQAARGHPEWQLRIFGTGPERDTLAALVDKHGLRDQVHLMGRTRQMNRELARASVYALSSRFEGFPMVLIEAMSVGLPVVAFDCPRGPGDLVVNGENGLLIPDQDVDALAAGLRRVIEDDALRSTMATAARRTATDYCLDGPLGRMWRRLLSELAASGPSS